MSLAPLHHVANRDCVLTIRLKMQGKPHARREIIEIALTPNEASPAYGSPQTSDGQSHSPGKSTSTSPKSVGSTGSLRSALISRVRCPRRCGSRHIALRFLQKCRGEFRDGQSGDGEIIVLLRNHVGEQRVHGFGLIVRLIDDLAHRPIGGCAGCLPSWCENGAVSGRHRGRKPADLRAAADGK
jgi:hypothetical protein